MKNKYIYIITCLAILFSACAEDKVKNYELIDLKVKLNLSDYEGELEKPVTLKLTSLSGIVGTERTIEVSSTKDAVNITGLVPGRYMLSVSGNLSKADAKQIFGTESEMMLRGGKSNVQIFDYTVDSLMELDMEISTTSSLIFKEIFYSGSKYTKPGATSTTSYFFEQFYEIYNNSDEVVYLDSLCISNTYPLSKAPLSFGELDEKYLFGISVWMIPGTGKDTPLAPGKSVVLTISGRNHKDVDETLLDLSSADYEAFVGSVSGREPLDYPVPNLIPAYWVQRSTVNQWNVANAGAGMVIYKLDYPFKADDTAKPLNTSETTLYVKIPKSSILDAVDCLKDNSVSKEKRFPAVFDAGYATVLETYNGKSIARKILQTTTDGRIIFQDTNNSSEDFEVMDRAMIRRYLNK